MTICKRCGNLRISDLSITCRCSSIPDYIFRLDSKLDEILRILKDKGN